MGPEGAVETGYHTLAQGFRMLTIDTIRFPLDACSPS
jgi:hypothetical protein